MKQYKFVIFDWDGTLMDSVGRIVASMQAAAKSVQVEMPSDKDVKNIIGLSLVAALDKLFPTRTQAQEEQLIAAYKEQYLTGCTVPTPLFNYAEELLVNLTKVNKLIAVATGKGRQGLDRVMNESGTTHYFHSSTCADEAKSKPDPEMIQLLLNELSIEPSDAVMIGDTIHDMEMARRAGVDRIGVTFGVHNKQELLPYEPVAIVDSLAELEKLLIA